MGGRFSDRIGKSVRTAPRDAIMSESVNQDERGKMFGIQRAMDFSGAFMGGLIALLLVHFLGPHFQGNGFFTPEFFRTAFLISLIPAGFGVVILFFIKEPAVLTSKEGKKPVPLTFKGLDAKLRIFLLATFIFGLGNSSNQFLILVTQDIGWTLLVSTAMYLLYNLVSALLLPYFGKLSDKIGRRKVILVGYLLYAIVYLGFGIFKVLDFKYAFLLLWVLYGVYSAMTEGVEKADVADLSPVEKRGTTLGLFATINGVALLPASIGAGFLYVLNPALPFLVGGLLALLSTFLIFLNGPRGQGEG
jgi:MFS family permease